MAYNIIHCTNSRLDGKPGGVEIRPWYNKNWDFILRPTSSLLASKLVAQAKGAQSIADQTQTRISYNQATRNELLDAAEHYAEVPWQLSTVLKPTSSDCSAFVGTCLCCSQQSNLFGSWIPSTQYMKSYYTKTGLFTVLVGDAYTKSTDYLKPGDIIVREGATEGSNNGHTMMFVGDENGRPGSKANSTPPSSTNTSTTQSASTDTSIQKQVWDYLKGKGLSDEAVAGIMGNLEKESNFQTDIVEIGMIKQLGFSKSSEYTAEVDKNIKDKKEKIWPEEYKTGTFYRYSKTTKSYSIPTDSLVSYVGYGMCQWTDQTRKYGLAQAASSGVSVSDIRVQLDFIIQECSAGAWYTPFKSSTNIQDATKTFFEKFEGISLEFNESTYASERIKKAQNWYNKYSGSANSTNDIIYYGGATSSGTLLVRKNIATTTVQASNQVKKSDSGTTKIITVDTDVGRTKTASLLSYPSLVESPFIIVKIGNYTFGSYTKSGSITTANSKMNVTYPNYMNSIDIVKVNGTVNTYTIQMIYQVQPGDDPNLLDKIFGSVGYNTIKISYGDWSCPTYIYSEEEALITGLKSNIDFSNSRITYTLSCTSTALSLMGTTFNFPHYDSEKPSNIVRRLLSNSSYGLTSMFTGMRTSSMRSSNVPSDDKAVEIQAKSNTDVITYLNYLVSCMTPQTSSSTSALQNGSYYLTIHDDVSNEYGGSYFTITEVSSSSGILPTADTYEVDVGFPSDNLVTEFKIINDNSWSLLYNYNKLIDVPNYTYSIDNNGNITMDYSLNLTTSSKYNKTTISNKTWWTQMTQFPITATLTVKGLIRPSMLMTYVRVNALFNGQRHISSGLYVIVKQQDRLDSNGYKTTLTLQRIAGDLDYIVTTKEDTSTNTSTTQNTKRQGTFGRDSSGIGGTR